MLAKYAGESAQMGLAAFLSYLALVSINLGVFNLIPIPPLDGGHLMGYAWQGLRGREMSERWRQGLQKLGLFLVVLLSVFALRNDLMRLLGLAP
jgi:regulator of sigma E protease